MVTVGQEKEVSPLQEMTQALIAFQKNLPEIHFNAQVKYGATNFKYADLAQMLKILRPLLNEHGFALSQLVDARVDAGGNPYGVVKTILLHERGEALTSDTFYNITGKPQDQGSGITYARRYALAAICGICAEEDDDAQTAAKGLSKKEEPKPNVPKPPTEADRAAFKKFVAEAKSPVEIKRHRDDFLTKFKLTGAMQQAFDNLVEARIKELGA